MAESRKNELIARLYELGGDVEGLLVLHGESDLEDLSEEVLSQVAEEWEHQKEGRGYET